MRTLLTGSIALKLQSPNYCLKTNDVDFFTDVKTNHVGNVEFLYSPIIFNHKDLHNGFIVNIKGLYNIKIVAAEYKHKQEKHLSDIAYIEKEHPDLAIRNESFLKEQREFLKTIINEN